MRNPFQNLLSTALVFCLSMVPALAQDRHALVVGIDGYDHVEDLQKARNDARSIHAALEEAGFEADLLLDTAGMALLQGLERFASRVEPGDEAVFFYAGHGVELDGENFLLPADIPAPERGGNLLIRRFALPVQDVLDTIQSRGARVALLMLDACRDNPFPRQGTRSLGGTRGLARMQAPEGAYIMYSAGAGQAALDRLSNDDPDPNSVFTRALLPRLTTPGMRLRNMVLEVRSEVRKMADGIGHNQFPAVYDQLDGTFRFIPAAMAPAPEQTQRDTSCAAARSVWAALQNTEDEAALTAFAEGYADGCPALAAEAQQALANRKESVSDDAEEETIPANAPRYRVRPSGGLNARTGPGTEHDILRTLPASSKLRELSREGDWSRVALPDDQMAWVHNDYILAPDEHDRRLKEMQTTSKSDNEAEGTGNSTTTHRTHQVKGWETIYSIAHEYGVPVSEIASANNFDPWGHQAGIPEGIETLIIP